ncbi:MAG TPA: hypothetical protein VHT73_08205 [Thermodesulfobacteriota bacterium]|nr:hypothetical protein [Thermodesulfobacteriota bacterium]
MSRLFVIQILMLILFLIGVLSVKAEQRHLSVTEFRQLYDSLLSGKTLVSEAKQGGAVIRKERRYYPPLETGDGEFEIPITIAVTETVDGKLQQKTSIDILDRVNNLGGQVLIYEEYKRTTVEKPDEGTRTTKEVEFGGLFRVARNEKGGFDVHNFGLMPSVLAEENSTSLAGIMAQYSCFPEKGITKCVLTIRDYKLGGYEPLVGYKLAEPAGGDFVEITEEVRQ